MNSNINTLVFFDNMRCFELSEEALPTDVHFEHEELSCLAREVPLIKQLSIEPNTFFELFGELKILLATAQKQYFSIFDIKHVRMGSMPGDHIKFKDTMASMTIYDGILAVHEDADVYINGKKVNPGEYPLEIGDCIWAGTTRIVIHHNYLECVGTEYESNLKLSLVTPELYEGFPEYKRSPRIIKKEPKDEIELTPPKEKEERKKGELLRLILPPMIMSSVMVVGSFLLGRGLFVLISAAAMTASVIFSTTMYFSDKKDRKKKEKERDENYAKYLLDKRKQLHELRKKQKESLLYHNLSPKEIASEIANYSGRIYERAANDSDFLTVSLGYGTISPSFKVRSNDNTDSKDPLVNEMRDLAAAYQTVEDVPVVVDLKAAHLGLVGDKPYIHRQLTSILTQLCFYQSYHDIEIVTLMEEEYRKDFEWIRRYPHCRIKNINVTGLVTSENQRDQVLGNLAQMLKMRKQKQEEEKKDSRFMPHYIFIIDNPKLILSHSIMEYLQSADTSLGFSVIYTTELQANLPENIKTVFLLMGGDHGNLLLDKGDLIDRAVVLPSTAGVDFDGMARKLAPLKHSHGVSTQIPESVTFFELYGVKRPEEIPVVNLWGQNACHKSLAVPLGRRSKEDVVALDLHEKSHGPHGLVAGTTGSGKSEIVQSYILSLAANFHPHEVGFLLIDYKGGGMANLFANLPHLLGTITNLDGSESMRALASIKSELANRQRVFNEHNVNSINQYTKMFKAGEAKLPLPHLFIISDEFAELKKEQPEFMAELVSTARIGRSLGVHLILATQKPSGVVDDQIWSNSKFKLALKVANDSDSNEVLKTPDAARITQPGRAYLQVGNNEIYELFQSAWSGAPYSEYVVEHGFDNRVYLINQLGQGVLLNEDLSEVNQIEDSKLTQLDVTVNHIQEIYQKMNAKEVKKPWLPPLETKIVTPAIETGHDVGQIDTCNLELAIGMVDIPEEQLQKELTHDFFADGNLAIFGASGFGKSTTLMTTALTLASQNSPELLNYFIMDYGNSALVQLKGLPHTADYIGFEDMEKLDKMMKLMTDEIKTRKHLFATTNALNFRMYNEMASEKVPAIVLFIDNGDVIREISTDVEDFLVKLTRDGPGIGIYTIITGSRANSVRYSILNNFKNKIAQFMFDSSDIMSVVGRSQYQLPEIRGRALVKLQDIHIMQCYLPVAYEDDISYAKLIGEVVADIANNNTASKAKGVRIVPETVTYDDLIPYLKTNARQAMLGFDKESTEPTYLDFSIPNHLIAGAPLTGKTNLLKLIFTQFAGHKCFISDSRAGDLQDYEGFPEVVYMSSENHLEEFYNKLSEEEARLRQEFEESGMRIREFCATQPVITVLIDDAENFIDLCKAKALEMETLIARAMEVGIVVIATTLPTKLRGYDVLTKIFKEAQNGLVLGSPNEQTLIQVQAPRDYKAKADIGFWFKRGDFRQVKLPFMQ